MLWTLTLRSSFRPGGLAEESDTVDHDVLMNRVSRRVGDKGILRLIGRYLRAGVMVDGRLKQTAKGVPQGGPLSPLLSNILPDGLDKELERRGRRFARYADDLIILVKSERAAYRVMESISRYLEKHLKVKVNRDKSRIVKAEESSFLGFTFTRKKLSVSEKSIMRFKAELLSRKGYWHLSKTLSTNCGLSNAHLEKQGLTSIRTLWIGIHYPAKT